jgi:uncharacterized protein (DUF1778 family)
MSGSRPVTISTRVSVRTRRLAEAAAELQGATLSQFAAAAIEHAARQQLRPEPDVTGSREDQG